MKTCPKGHKYDDKYDECPYCPGSFNTATNLDNPGKSGNADKGDFIDPSMTVVDEIPEELLEPEEFEAGGTGVDFSKTVIMKSADKREGKSVSGRIEQQRMLVGFLVSYTWNPFGDYFEIREGKTKIGGDAGADIRVADAMVSGVHAQLVYRNGVLRVKDNFSTNGTWVNDEDIGDSAKKLANRDVLRLGKSVFKLLLVEGD